MLLYAIVVQFMPIIVACYLVHIYMYAFFDFKENLLITPRSVVFRILVHDK